MKRIFLSACCSCLAVVSIAQSPEPVAETSSTDDIFKNASIVTTEENIVFTVKSIDDARLDVHRILTVLSKEGEEALQFAEYGDKFHKVEDAEIKVYDAKGKLLNRYKKKEMQTEALGEGLVDDGRVIHFKVTAPSYPVTVEYNYSIKFNATLTYPDYEIQPGGRAVLSSSFTAIVPADLGLRYKSGKIDIQPVISTEGKNKKFVWAVKNLPTYRFERGTATARTKYPRIFLAPVRFDMDGNEGDLTSWSGFGAWMRDLSKGTDELPAERATFFRNLVKDENEDVAKIRMIYEYVQKNCRYVSIQLGIGGYKPFPASFTDSKKYGDCKGLSNYMKGALSAVGIRSHLALINAQYNNEAVDPAFPMNAFNHMILCVPVKDTVWLECTSTTADFGVLGTFTENKNAVLVTDAGGVLVATPKGNPAENTTSTFSTIALRENGSGHLDGIVRSKGAYRELMKSLSEQNSDVRNYYFFVSMGYKQPDDYNFSFDKNGEKLDLRMEMAAVPDMKTSKKMFLKECLYTFSENKLVGNDKRVQTYYFEEPFIKSDTTVYLLPEGYAVESLPVAASFKFSKGSFVSNVKYDKEKNSVTATARLVLNDNKILPAEYMDAWKFFDKINAERNDRIVITKK